MNTSLKKKPYLALRNGKQSVIQNVTAPKDPLRVLVATQVPLPPKSSQWAIQTVKCCLILPGRERSLWLSFTLIFWRGSEGMEWASIMMMDEWAAGRAGPLGRHSTHTHTHIHTHSHNSRPTLHHTHTQSPPCTHTRTSFTHIHITLDPLYTIHISNLHSTHTLSHIHTTQTFS